MSIERTEETLLQARRTVEQNAGIAMVEKLREQFFDAFGAFYQESEVTATARESGLTADDLLRELYRQTTDQARERFAPVIERTKARVAANRLGERRVFSPIQTLVTVRRFAEQAFANIFNNIKEETVPQLEELLRDRESREILVQEMEQLVTSLSQRELLEIDQSERQGKRTKKEIVIIGGGPLTSLAGAILAPFYEKITVVTQDSSLGGGWLDRGLFINSSAAQALYDAVRLPLIDTGSSTPITPMKFINYVDLAIFDEDTLEVLCRDGNVRSYPNGFQLGAAVLANILLGTSSNLTEQAVQFRETRLNPDGTKTLVLLGKDGRRREIDADTVICLTGPGREVVRIPEAQSRNEAEQAILALDVLIEETRAAYAKLRGKPESERNAILLVRDFERRLPRILTQTGIEKIHRLWRVDFKSHPDLFPLRDFYTNPAYQIVMIGGGDTTKVCKEAQDGNGPAGTYPPNLTVTANQVVTLVGYPYGSVEDVKRNERPRYGRVQNVLNDVTTDVSPDRVAGWSKVRIGNRDFYRVYEADQSGQLTGNYTDCTHIIVSTGLDQTPVADEFARAGFGLDIYKDLEGKPVGLFDSRGILIGGSATRFQFEDFPEEIQAILRLIAKENTAALWAFGALLERGLWTLLYDLFTEMQGAAGVRNTRLENALASLTQK